jgi:hypothetical protein
VNPEIISENCEGTGWTFSIIILHFPCQTTTDTGTTTTNNKQGELTMLTHRRHSARLSTNVVLFAEGGNEQYGQHVWTLATELPMASEDVELIAFAAEFYAVDIVEAAELVNPIDIVDSAGAWDDAQFVSECWQRFERTGYRTYDGAVVLDNTAVELIYSVDAE